MIAAAISPHGVCRQLVLKWVDGAFELVISPALLDELEEVLLRPKFRRYLTDGEAREFSHALAGLADRFPSDPPEEHGLTSDPDDDYLVSLARAADADAIVSGDPDLTGLIDPKPAVLSPRAALDLIAPQPARVARGQVADSEVDHTRHDSYLRIVVTHSDALGRAMHHQGVTAASAAGAPSPMRLARVAKAVTEVHDRAAEFLDQLASSSPPPYMRGADGQLQDALKLLVDGGRRAADAALARDEPQLISAANEMTIANRDVTTTAIQIIKWRAGRARPQ